MKKRKWKYIIGIVILVLLSVFVLAGCKRKQDKNQENTGIEEDLQVEEDGEGESATFEEIFSTESEENKTDTGASDVTDQKKPSSENTTKTDSVKESEENETDTDASDATEQKKPSSGDDVEDSDEKDNDEKDESKEKGHITGEEEDKEEGWGPII